MGNQKKEVFVMKNKLIRIGSIGALHTIVYAWLLPRMILPRFGNMGSKITVGILVLISLVILTASFGKKK